MFFFCLKSQYNLRSAAQKDVNFIVILDKKTLKSCLKPSISNHLPDKTHSNKIKNFENYGKTLFFAHKKALKLSHELGTFSNKDRYALYHKDLTLKDRSVEFEWWDDIGERRINKRKLRFDHGSCSNRGSGNKDHLKNENNIALNRYSLLVNDLTKKEAASLYRSFSKKDINKCIYCNKCNIHHQHNHTIEMRQKLTQKGQRNTKRGQKSGQTSMQNVLEK